MRADPVLIAFSTWLDEQADKEWCLSKQIVHPGLARDHVMRAKALNDAMWELGKLTVAARKERERK